MKPIFRSPMMSSKVVRALILATTPFLLAVPMSAQETNPSPLAPHITENSTLPNGIASGDVTQTSAVLWTRSTELGQVVFDVGTTPEIVSGDMSMSVEVTDALLPVKVEIDGLSANTTYYYTVTDAAGTTLSGQFITAAEDGEAVGLRFGASGDWRGELAPYPGIANADERELAFFVLHGDTIYADYASPALPQDQAITLEDYRIKHSEVYGARYGMNTFADLRAVTSIYALIDDHEVTNDFAGGASPDTDARFADEDVEFVNDTELYENGLQAFQEYNPIRDEFYENSEDLRTAGERRLYRYQTYGDDAAVFLIDARSFRDAELPGVTSFTEEAVGEYLAAAFDPERTMLGDTQFADLLADLSDAQARGITWKFLFVPEPAQNFGVVGASDRYEGYAAERSALMRYIVENGITNVVFVAADIHGTVVNDLYYQDAPGGEQLPVDAFEISTGSVAFDAPFGPTLIEIASQLEFLTAQQTGLYNILPVSAKETFITQLIDGQLEPLGYNLIGLEGSSLENELVSGDWLATHTYGWTEFDIDAETQALTIITYGIPWYTQAEMEADPESVTARVPEVVSEFIVRPQ